MPDALSVWAQKMQAGLRPAMHLAVADALEATRRKAIEYSSGTLTPVQSAAMGYAYSRRHAAPLLDPAIINVQTGMLRASWTFNGPRHSGDGIEGEVFNVDPKAAKVEAGDHRVWGRPIAERVARDVQPEVEAIIGKALAGLLQP